MTVKTETKLNCIYEVIDTENIEENIEKNIKKNENKIEENKIDKIENKVSNYNSYIDSYYNEKIEFNNIKCNWCLLNVVKKYLLPYNINNETFNMYENFCCLNVWQHLILMN